MMTGSTWLMSVLNQQPDVFCYGEETLMTGLEATLSRPFSKPDAEVALKVVALDGKVKNFSTQIPRSSSDIGFRLI